MDLVSINGDQSGFISLSMIPKRDAIFIFRPRRNLSMLFRGLLTIRVCPNFVGNANAVAPSEPNTRL
jgi:hypothetical protein